MIQLLYSLQDPTRLRTQEPFSTLPFNPSLSFNRTLKRFLVANAAPHFVSLARAMGQTMSVQVDPMTLQFPTWSIDSSGVITTDGAEMLIETGQYDKTAAKEAASDLGVSVDRSADD